VEFLEVLKQKDSLVMKEVFKCFDLDMNGTVELKEFVTVLSSYTTASKSDKLKFSFMMFDEDGSGRRAIIIMYLFTILIAFIPMINIELISEDVT
jgi:Ca2+-binding EF-hand superfamily protein